MKKASEDSFLAIFEMRSELGNAMEFIKSNNNAGVKASLRSCQFDARRFFDGDQNSIDDFKAKLRNIYSCCKQEDSDQALALTEHLFSQIEMLITHLADSGAFSDSAIDLYANVLADRLTDQLEARGSVSDFDMAAGHYCQEIFPTIPGNHNEFMVGVALMLKGIFLGQFADGRPSIELIKSKRSQDDESKTSIDTAVTFAKALTDKRIMKGVEELSRKNKTPRLVYYANHVVSISQKHGEYPGEPEVVTRGYVAAIAWMVIQIGLCMHQLLPQTTRAMAEELDNDFNFKVIVAARAQK
jgi:hypothetical protein